MSSDPLQTDSPSTSKRSRRWVRRSLRLSAGAVLLLLVAAPFVERWGYGVLTAGEFYAVKRDYRWYSFDPGEHPEIDGVRFEGEPVELPASASFRDRTARPTRWEPVSDELFVVYGVLRVDHSLVGGRSWVIPWLEHIEPDLRLSARVLPPGGRASTVAYSAGALRPGLPVIADYLDLHYPGTGLGDELRRGGRDRYRLIRSQLPVLAFQVLALVGLVWLALPWRWRTRHVGSL